MKHSVRSVVCLAILIGVCHASADKARPSGWSVYRSSDYGFEIAYAPDMSYTPITRSSYIPVCAHENVVCFEYTGDEYKGTNFGAAGLSINVLRDRRTEEDCNAIDSGSYPAKKATINGTNFHYAETAEGMMSHWIGGPLYRTFHEGVCFELVVGITGTNMGAYDPGQVKEFREAKLRQELEAMVQTFRFVGHVVDGPAWSVHHMWGCGGTFEYPDGDTVVTVIKYSNERYYSQDLSCQDHFVHGGRYYTLSNKANLPTQDDFSRWLVSAGYPGLSEARVLGRTPRYTVYQAGPYRYVYGQVKAFILSVSDAKGNATDPNRDRVFRHFANSFKPERDVLTAQ